MPLGRAVYRGSGRLTGVRRRIVTLTVVAAMLAIGLFGLPFAVVAAKYYADDERAELERAADSSALAVSDDLSAGVVSPALPPSPHNITVALYSPGGQLRSGTGPPTADQVVTDARNTDLSSGDVGSNIVVAVPIINGATLAGVIRASTPRTEVYRRTALTGLGMIGLAALAVGATWLVARRLAARLARPLEELSTAAERLGDGDFTVRAHRTGIAEIDQVAATLAATAQRIGETLDRERAFSADASHQLRTPLTGLRLQLEAALDSPGQDPSEAIASGIASADRLERTIDDLLALARRSRTPKALVDVDALLDELRQGWNGLLANRGRELRISAGDVPPPRAAAAAVRQILGVLLDNAVTHGQGTVRVSVRDAGDAFAVDVSDEGPGLDGDLDVFASDRASGNGHGIGLTLARSLAEAEGGRLRLSTPSPPTFTLFLPIDEPTEGPVGTGLGG
ncbi:MAG: two-component sensor histidine kinase [Amycolatopsis sp.]|nr:two-component sensor histidine kinase [Amycolatopsis sp.]